MLSIDFKYLAKIAAEGTVVALAAYAIPNKKIRVKEIIAIALTAMVTFAIVDMFAPSMASAARLGSGFTIGAKMIGGGAQIGIDEEEDDSSADDNRNGSKKKRRGGSNRGKEEEIEDEGNSDDVNTPCHQCSSYKFEDEEEDDVSSKGPYPTGEGLLDM